jgi:glyoxylase-like metal-dependent hydrolase (beta-lactamase superfamily II)
VFQVSPHLFKFKRPNFWPNFGLILADSGRALVVDCGLLDEKFLDAALDGLRQHFGLKAIDAVVITHMHGDHFLEAPHLRDKWGAQIWALDIMVDKMEHPEWFDYAAPIQAYGKKNPDGTPMTGVSVDRTLKSGERFTWEGYEFTVDWMPGQTEFALCLHGLIDGRKVAFTGDNIFGDPDNPTHTGHEALVAHNSAILEEGYIYAGEYLKRLKPDILIGGHSFVMDRPAKFIERYRRWAYDMRDAFRTLSPEREYRYWFDPFWVRAEPYRVVDGNVGVDSAFIGGEFFDCTGRGLASVSRPGRTRAIVGSRIASEVDGYGERCLEDRGARRILVIADCVGRSRVRHDRDRRGKILSRVGT